MASGQLAMKEEKRHWKLPDHFGLRASGMRALGFRVKDICIYVIEFRVRI